EVSAVVRSGVAGLPSPHSAEFRPDVGKVLNALGVLGCFFGGFAFPFWGGFWFGCVCGAGLLCGGGGRVRGGHGLDVATPHQGQSEDGGTSKGGAVHAAVSLGASTSMMSPIR